MQPEDPFDDLDIDDDHDDDLQQSWADLARQLPGRDDLTRLEDQNLLGSRDLDRAYDWALNIGMFADLRADFLEQMKVQYPADITAHSSADPEALEFKQRRLYDLIVDDYRRVLRSETTQQFLVNLDGKAGTGKSHVIMLISSVLDQMTKDAGKTGSPILRAAPTGVAAYGIGGRTLHGLFRLPVRGSSCTDLNRQTLQALQATFRGVR